MNFSDLTLGENPFAEQIRKQPYQKLVRREKPSHSDSTDRVELLNLQSTFYQELPPRMMGEELDMSSYF